MYQQDYIINLINTEEVIYQKAERLSEATWQPVSEV